MDKRIKVVSLFLRVGLAFVFLYAGIGSLRNPSEWIGFMPQFMSSIAPLDILLGIFSVYEIILGFWLLWGKYAFYSAILSGLSILGIIVFNPDAFSITFRDIAIIFSALALAVVEKPSLKNQAPN